MKCPCCARRFKSKERYKLYLRQQGVLADLRATRGPIRTYSSTPDLSKIDRHRAESAQARQSGSP